MNTLFRWLRSFGFAYEGMKYALLTQRNMKFHFFTAFLALGFALLLKLSKTDILFILLAVTLVVVTELINTAVEKAVDLAMPDRHPLAKISKDVAAAAVLVASVFAAAVGLIVFYEPVSRLLSGAQRDKDITPGAVLVYVALVILTVIVIETRFTEKRRIRPSLWTAVAFSVSTLLALITADTLAALLAFGLASLFVLSQLRQPERNPASVLFGALLGIAITLLAFFLTY